MEDEIMSYRILSCLGIFTFSLFSPATVSTASVPTGLPDFKPNGGFSIQLNNGGIWQEIGFLSFDEFFREKRLKFPGRKVVYT